MRLWCAKSYNQYVKRYRRLRRLRPDAELIRRRAAGEALRELARDYGVRHTTLSRYFARPEVVKQLREAARLLRAERQAVAARLHAEQKAKREVGRLAQQQGAEGRGAAGRAEPEPAAQESAARSVSRIGRRPSAVDQAAARAVEAGEGMEAVIELTRLGPLGNALGLVDPAVLERALENDAARTAAIRLRRLKPDAELYRRRAAGEALRMLALDYDVAHTTLSRHFARPQAAKQLKQAERLLRAERRTAAARRSAERRFERDVRRKAKEQLAFEQERASLAARRRPSSAGRRPARTARAAWLDARDARLPLSRTDLYSLNDHAAARAAAAGGGIEDVLQATGLRTHDNLLHAIDPTILKRALDNDTARAAAAEAAN